MTKIKRTIYKHMNMNIILLKKNEHRQLKSSMLFVFCGLGIVSVVFDCSHCAKEVRHVALTARSAVNATWRVNEHQDYGDIFCSYPQRRTRLGASVTRLPKCHLSRDGEIIPTEEGKSKNFMYILNNTLAQTVMHCTIHIEAGLVTEGTAVAATLEQPYAFSWLKF